MDKNDFKEYMEIFLEENSKLNLISKNDEKFLWEKHIFDSLAIEKFFEKHKNYPLLLKEGRISTQEPSSGKISGECIRLLDIGTGGGFPAVLIALAYPRIEVFALDSIRKKIIAVENIKEKLNIKNLHPVCGRAENIKQKFDIITSRAVASLDKISAYAMPLLNKDGFFIAYKSIRAKDEIAHAKDVLKKYNAEVIDVIEYDLPLTENYTRNLIVIKIN